MEAKAEINYNFRVVQGLQNSDLTVLTFKYLPFFLKINDLPFDLNFLTSPLDYRSQYSWNTCKCYTAFAW